MICFEKIQNFVNKINIFNFIFQLICQQDELFWDEMCISWNMTDYCTTPNHKFKNNGIAILNVNILMVDTTDQVK